jgi:hypothetical protein
LSIPTYKELFLLFLCRLIVEATGLDDLVVDVKLIPRTSIHCLLDALLRDEPQNTNDLCLTNTVSTILSLEIGMWVPVTIIAASRSPSMIMEDVIEENDKHDDRISGLQVQAKTSSTGGEDEDFVLGIRGVEELHMSGTILGLRATIEAEVFPVHHLQEILHDVHDLRHLEEN